MGQWARSICHSVSGRRAGRLPGLSQIVFVVCLYQLSQCDTVYIPGMYLVIASLAVEEFLIR
jgi:hypothetical protein